MIRRPTPSIRATPATPAAAAPGGRPELAPGGLDALDLLGQAHEEARALADECRRFARSVSPEHEVQPLAETLCTVLHRLSEIEEELFCPATRAVLPPLVVQLAELENATAREIIRQLQLTDPAQPRYEALLVALSDCVERHVQHEQRELFPRLRAAAVDLRALGARIRERHAQAWSTH